MSIIAEAPKGRLRLTWQIGWQHHVIATFRAGVSSSKTHVLALQGRRISVHTLSGHIRFHPPEQTVELPAAHMLALEPDIPHDLEAVVDSAFLLTIEWPSPSSADVQDETQSSRTDAGAPPRFREMGLDKTLADTFPCNDSLWLDASIPYSEKYETLRLKNFVLHCL